MISTLHIWYSKVGYAHYAQFQVAFLLAAWGYAPEFGLAPSCPHFSDTRPTTCHYTAGVVVLQVV